MAEKSQQDKIDQRKSQRYIQMANIKTRNSQKFIQIKEKLDFMQTKDKGILEEVNYLPNLSKPNFKRNRNLMNRGKSETDIIKKSSNAQNDLKYLKIPKKKEMEYFKQVQ